MSSDSAASPFRSALEKSAHRYLSEVIVHALTDNWRTPDDFLRHFKPLDIMAGLAAAPDLRADLLIKAAGVHEKIARKKSTESAAEDMQIALDEGITNPKAVLELFPPDDRVRYLDHKRLWSFVVEDQFWLPANAKAKGERAVRRMTFMLEDALVQKLVTLKDIADGITFETISQQLPLDQLKKVVKHALETGRKAQPLTEPSLLDVVPLDKLIGYIPLDHVWNGTVIAKIASPCAFVDASAPEAENAEGAAEKPGGKTPSLRTKEELPAAQREPLKAAILAAKDSVPDSKPQRAEAEPIAPAPATTSALADAVESDDEARMVASAASMLGADRSPQEEEARRKVCDRLRTIERLPPKHDELSTPILLSIDSMYAELLGCSDDESRETCIRDSFPNENHLRTALLALIELLDQSIDVADPLIRDAEADALIKVVLFEERHRYEQRVRLGQPPATSGPRRASVPPPPLPRPGDSRRK
jgi:hypothetical protein